MDSFKYINDTEENNKNRIQKKSSNQRNSTQRLTTNQRLSNSHISSSKKIPSVSSKEDHIEKKNIGSSTLFPTTAQNLMEKSFKQKSTMDYGTTTNNDDSC